MKQNLLIPTFALILISLSLQPLHAANSSGAIFTTTPNGSRVNANIYTSKCEVYLDGGPGPNAPAGAAGLPDGAYYFQVTDPSGRYLLSTDPVTNRKIQVTNGVISAYIGFGGPVHPLGYDQDHPELGAITIRIGNANCPADYLDSPNGGGVYKVWITPVGDFVGNPANVDNDCGNGCFHGFVSSKSKTDNFKAQVGAPTFCVTVWKRIISNGVETPGAAWPITVTDPLTVKNLYFTAQDGFLRVCGLSTGNYKVTEDTMQGTYTPVEVLVNGSSAPNLPYYEFTWSPGLPEPVIIFKNSPSDGIPMD